MVFHIDIVFLYDIDGFSLRYRISKGRQWFFQSISYFYVTSMVCPVDIVFLYDIDGFSHRYRIFICHQWFFP